MGPPREHGGATTGRCAFTHNATAFNGATARTRWRGQAFATASTYPGPSMRTPREHGGEVLFATDSTNIPRAFNGATARTRWRGLRRSSGCTIRSQTFNGATARTRWREEVLREAV